MPRRERLSGDKGDRLSVVVRGSPECLTPLTREAAAKRITPPVKILANIYLTHLAAYSVRGVLEASPHELIGIGNGGVLSSRDALPDPAREQGELRGSGLKANLHSLDESSRGKQGAVSCLEKGLISAALLVARL